MSKIDLYNGDCLEIMKNIPDKSIDMILCDLPYGITECKWDVVIPFDKLWEQYNRIIKDNGAIVLFGSEPFSTKLRYSNLKMYSYDWKWIKSKPIGHLNSHKKPMNKYEDIMVFSRKQPVYNPQGLVEIKPKIVNRNNKGGIYGKSFDKPTIMKFTNYPVNIIEFKSEKGKFHPTQKPVPLLEYLIKTYTNEEMTVLDNCMGSGSTGVACKNTNRNFIGIELDKDYFEIAKKRIEEA